MKTAAPRFRPLLFHRLIATTILLVGIAASIVAYRAGRQEEYERAEAQFVRRASVRHALTREILGRYEDALFGLSTLFMFDANVTRSEFSRATSRLEARITGAQAFQWVPVVTGENRATFEATMQRYYPRRTFEISQFDATGQRVRAPEREIYYPIAYVQPLRGNEPALGYDLQTGPTLPILERARETRHMLVTPQVRLVQEQADQRGVVMVWAVFRTPRAPAAAPASADNPAPAVPAPPPATPAQPPPEVFIGFLQCVFRVHDFLENARGLQSDPILDMLFVDRSEPDPTKRVLYYRPVDDRALQGPVPTEAEFAAGLAREHALPFGQRDWRVIYRPQAGWLESQTSTVPLLRSLSLTLLATLLAGLVRLVGRQAETIQREVDERTAELAESRRQLATLLHELPGMAYRCSYQEQLGVLFVSEGALALTGWPAEDFLSGKIHFREIIHPGDLARVREATLAALQDRKEVEIEYRIRTRDGAEKWVLSRGRGVYGDDGRPLLFEGLAIDITAQKNAETARLGLERKLLEGQKLESLGLLAGGIAHDFNNLLSSILGNASITRLALPPGTGSDAQLRAIETASLRAAELCKQMLAYAGKGRFVVEPTQLTAITEDLLPLLRISIAHQATLDLRLARDLPPVMADATQLRQIVMNLVLNAADAIGDRGGTITVTTCVGHVDADTFLRAVAGAGLRSGNYVQLEVRDTGCGMEPEVMAKIFDPFFTTKFAGRGLGLAAVLGIVRGHNGGLVVESTPGQGSTFRLFLPPVERSAAVPPKPAAASAGRWTHAGTVLVVEDEEPVRLITTQILRTFGFTVLDAANGTEGLALFRADPSRVDLVMLDLLMPGLNGEQTLGALRLVKPDVPVLLMSGYTEGDLLRRLGNGGRLAFIAKPFTRDALEQKLRELLEEKK